MKRSRRAAAVAAAALLGCAGGAGTALAFDAQQFSVAPDATGYFSTFSSRTGPRGHYHFSVWYGYADDPGDALDRAHQISVVGTYSVADWLELGADLPFSSVSSDLPGVEESIGPDDVRLLAKLRLLDGRDRGLGFSLVPYVDFPTGEEDRLTADEEFSGGGLFVADYVTERFRAALNVGYEATIDADDEIRLAIAGGVPVLRGGARGLAIEILGEVFGGTEGSDPFDDEETTPAEFLLGARFAMPSGLYATLGAGRTITDSLNGPDFRVVGGIDYAPPPPSPPPAPPPPPPPPAPASKVVVTDEQLVTLEPIYFDFDRATIKSVSYPVLDQVEQILRRRANLRLRIEGHTDSVGSDRYNQALSDRRAQAVLRYLQDKGIERSRLEAVGFGESRPISTNDTDAGRAKNRRTEFHVQR